MNQVSTHVQRQVSACLFTCNMHLIAWPLQRSLVYGRNFQMLLLPLLLLLLFLLLLLSKELLLQ